MRGTASPASPACRERLLGFAAGRSLPRFRRDAFHDAELPAPDGREGEVILFPDVFNRYFEPENLRAAARVLAAAGYRVAVARPAKGARPLDEGRTLLAAGLVEEARAEARRTLGGAVRLRLARSSASSRPRLLTLRDEFPALLPGEAGRGRWPTARCCCRNSWCGRSPGWRCKPIAAAAAHIHGHCHQKSFGAFPAAVAMLTLRPRAEGDAHHLLLLRHGRRLRLRGRAPARSRRPWPSSRCCRRSAPRRPTHLIVADGTSCRHQIADLAGREALHSVRVLDRALA